MLRSNRGRFALIFLAFASLGIADQSANADESPVSGVFKGNGKEAKLAHVTAIKGEPYMDRPTIKLVFTEKDHSKEAKPHSWPASAGSAAP